MPDELINYYSEEDPKNSVIENYSAQKVFMLQAPWYLLYYYLLSSFQLLRHPQLRCQFELRTL